MELVITQIADLVKSNPQINFVGFAITPWQLLGVESCINYLRTYKKQIIEPGLVIMKPKETDFVLDEKDIRKSDFHFIVKHNEEFKITKIVFAFLQYIQFMYEDKGYGDGIYIACPAKLHLMFGNEVFRKTQRHIKFIITDEGVAQYMNTMSAKGNINVDTKTYIYRSINSFFNKCFLQKHDVMFHCLLQYTADHLWDINKLVAQSYLDIIKQKYDSQNSLFEKNSILICTTAWHREDITANEDYLILKKTVDLFKMKGYKIYLKTHPRDNFFEKKASEICDKQLDASLAIECVYCQEILPKYIISFSSTVLVTAKIFTGIQPICLTDLLDRKAISSFYLNEIDAFKSTFRDFVYFPNNWETIERILTLE